MRMKKIICPIMLATLAAALSVRAVAPPRGGDRLRELVVYPEINFTFNFSLNLQGGDWVITIATDPEVQISGLREELNRQPEDIDRLLQLGNLLNNRGETNDAKIYYRKAEQLCRDRVAARPRDGLALTDLGRTLWQLNELDAAESVYRQSVLVSPNEWRCWVRLGNFLSNESYAAMFPEKLMGQFAPSPVPPSPEALNFRPAPEALKQAEAACHEASRCFDRALALAHGEPGVFVQRAGFICESNCQSCFFRHFRNGEEIDSTRWVSAFFSPETCANLRKAATLNNRDYECTSLAAYFEWFLAIKAANWPTNASLKTLPDESARSIRDAMTHLDRLANGSDPKLAASASENLAILDLMTGNQASALDNSKRAVALAPASETSWDLLLASTSTPTTSPEDLVAICQSRLNRKNCARNHLLLAKCLTKAGQWNEATAQADAAGQLETNNIVPPLLVAAIALKQNEPTNHLSIASASLTRAYELLPKISDANERRNRAREFGLNIIIFYVLNQQPDLARNAAKDYLKLFPDSDAAKEILRDLGAD
jgi:tetratricopeptide (TPR) repeat protein